MEKIEIDCELNYLKKVLDAIEIHIKNTEELILKLEKEMRELTHHFSEEYYYLDDEETVTGGDELDDAERVINETKNEFYKLKKQKLSPYFGKIVFKDCATNKAENYYIGTFSLTNNTDVPLVCDWRAPVSSMFYDFEIGNAKYIAPQGEISGEILNKRQFKIKDSKMLYCFDSNLTIQDEILQQELANNADVKMKNIVSTIQKEQNLIIRDGSKVLFVQGIAGSGKTSIAMHRVAYLLYKFREKYTSKNILIISPNNIFSDYISSVLPSLGEQNIQSMSFYDIAQDELSTLTCGLQTKEESINEIIDDEQRLNEVAYKNCFEFCESLKVYLKTYVNVGFDAHDLTFGDVKIQKQKLEELYNKNYVEKMPSVRVGWIADYIIDQLDIKNNNEELYKRIKKVLLPMFIKSSLLDIYADFLNKIGMNFSLTKDNKVKNEDIAPILYLKHYILGLNKFKDIKYLVVDEMQDYSPIHYEMINEIFDCEKTIIGDINQCIDKIIDKQDLENYCKLVGAEKIIYLNKTYRSTDEIIEFCDTIKNLHSNSAHRHGENVDMHMCDDIENEAKYIENLIKNTKKYETIAIICKTQKEAELYYGLISNIENLNLLNENGEMSKYMIMPASTCKGLEFDMVVIPNVSRKNYKTFLDKNLLYVSCTRALHKLCLTSHTDFTKFIKTM